MSDNPPTRTGFVQLPTEPVDRLTRSFDRLLRIEAAGGGVLRLPQRVIDRGGPPRQLRLGSSD